MNSRVKKQFSRDGFGGKTANENADVLTEKVVRVGRCAKVVKGGRRFSFSALVVVGDKKGRIGVGYGRAHEVPEAVRKASEHAKNSMITIKLSGKTIPHEVIGCADGGRVLLKPASEGTGLIAGGGVRAILELAGVRDVLSKSMRSSNALATVRATLKALQSLRSREFIAKLRGFQITEKGE